MFLTGYAVLIHPTQSVISLLDISIIESKDYSLCLIRLSVRRNYTVQIPIFLAEIELATQNEH